MDERKNDEARQDERSGERRRDAPPGPGPVGGAGELDEDSFWGKVRRGVVEGYQIAAEKTDVYARIASRKLHVVGITRRVERYHAEIGERVYGLITRDPETKVSEDSVVKELVARIRKAEEELTLKEAEIEEIRQESRRGGAGRPEGTER
ncbi:MAG: hypothetical protein ABIH26_02495 [Candidatus Eisenbacteria bacterium]